MYEYCVGIDPGALRCGVAYLRKVADGYEYLWSGVMGLERGEKEEFGRYRRRLLEYWSDPDNELKLLLYRREPVTLVINERIPATHSRVGNSTQMLLGQIALAAIHTWLTGEGYTWEEVAANHVKKRMTNNKDATKVRIRNAVISVFPELDQYKKEWEADQYDAIAVALIGLGYKTP